MQFPVVKIVKGPNLFFVAIVLLLIALLGFTLTAVKWIVGFILFSVGCGLFAPVLRHWLWLDEEKELVAGFLEKKVDGKVKYMATIFEEGKTSKRRKVYVRIPSILCDDPEKATREASAVLWTLKC